MIGRSVVAVIAMLVVPQVVAAASPELPPPFDHEQTSASALWQAPEPYELGSSGVRIDVWVDRILERRSGELVRTQRIHLDQMTWTYDLCGVEPCLQFGRSCIYVNDDAGDLLVIDEHEETFAVHAVVPADYCGGSPEVRIDLVLERTFGWRTYTYRIDGARVIARGSNGSADLRFDGVAVTEPLSNGLSTFRQERVIIGPPGP